MDQLYEDGEWDIIFQKLHGYVENKANVVANLAVLGLRDGHWKQVLKLKKLGYSIDHPVGETFIQYLIHGNVKKASRMISVGLIDSDHFIAIRNRLYGYRGWNVDLIDQVVARIHWLQTKHNIN